LPAEVRSRDAAYRVYLQEQGEDVTGTEECPGAWTAECRKWGWRDRAEMWDAHLVKARARVIISRATAVAEKYVSRLLDAIDKAEAPSDWAGINDAVGVMNTWVTAESLKQVGEVPEEWKPKGEAGGPPAGLQILGPGDSDEDRSHDHYRPQP
jgi:hypothetical protein